jgi:hypothetical protein
MSQNVYFLFSRFLVQWFEWTKKATKCSMPDCIGVASIDGMCHGCVTVLELRRLRAIMEGGNLSPTVVYVSENVPRNDQGIPALPVGNIEDGSIFVPEVSVGTSFISESKGGKRKSVRSSKDLLDAAATLNEVEK